jgi:hypothetical protein
VTFLPGFFCVGKEETDEDDIKFFGRLFDPVAFLSKLFEFLLFGGDGLQILTKTIYID